MAEGGNVSGKKVCIKEDVVTTGGQIVESAGELRKWGAVIDTVLCVILRNNAAFDVLAAESLTLKPAFTMDDIKKTVSLD